MGFHNTALIGASGQDGYNLESSLRFRSSSSAILSWTPASAGNRKTWTWSGWVKRGTLNNGDAQVLFRAPTTDPSTGIRFSHPAASDLFNDGIRIFFNNAANGDLQTTQVFRDSSSWYHVIVSVDTTQVTASNRVKLYINGEQVTLFTTASYPAQNYDTQINNNTTHNIGAWVAGAEYFDGYMTEVNFIDGQALTPSDFGSYDTITGVWKPKRYTGTYGTNGFYLNFSDGTSTTTLGYDQSPNSNNWTLNNISLTAGATYDLMNDVPTLTDEDTANFATLNPLVTTVSTTSTITNGNLTLTGTNTNGVRCSTIGMSSDKWYAEITLTANPSNSDSVIGVVNATNTVFSYPGQTSDSYAIYCYPSNTYLQKVNNGTFTNTNTTTSATGNTISVAIDVTNNKIWFAKNGVWTDSGDPANSTNPAFTISSGTYYFAARGSGGAGTAILDWNFGQRPFKYTPPTGFKKLNTYNLPDSTIVQGNQYMDATLVTATGTTQTVTNDGGFKPSLLIIKTRAIVGDNNVIDSVRGLSNYLITNTSGAELVASTFIASFNSNGWTFGTGNYANGTSLVGWQWRGSDSSPVSNTDGTITSTVSANTTSGFSIATFTATSGNFTVGHGLGVAPKMTILKRRDSTGNWWTWHIGLGDNTDDYLSLNTTNAELSISNMWGSVGRNATVCGFNGTASAAASGTYVMYNFADVEGFSKFGSYAGNGSTDGPFIYTGFRPAFVLIKQSSVSGNSWQLLDTARETINPNDQVLFPNLSNAEGTLNATFDFLSNGLKVRTTDGTVNTNGATYIYMAFAENPFKNSLAR